MNIKIEAKRTEAKLEFFNRASPALQAELVASGYFRTEDVASDDESSAGLQLVQLRISTLA